MPNIRGFIYVTFTIQQQIQQCKSVLAVYVKNMYVYILYIDENIKGTRGAGGGLVKVNDSINCAPFMEFGRIFVMVM